jgi:isopenicillin N synthase-like dioxygenase
MPGVAVIDLSGEPARVAAEIGRACEEIGFLLVLGHGVDEKTVDRMAGLCREFFDLPSEEKLACAQGAPTLGLPAYRPLESESLAASGGEQAVGDFKESLDRGLAVPVPAGPRQGIPGWQAR